MSQSLSIPLAWCVELEKLVTPQDILSHRVKHPNQTLNFVCPECNFSIAFHPRITGIRAQAYFIRKTGQYHQSCIEVIKRKYPEPLKLTLMQMFEDLYVKIESTTEELASLFYQLSEVCISLREETHTSCGPEQLELFKLLKQNILHSKKDDLKTSLQQISTIYLDLRKYLQGF